MAFPTQSVLFDGSTQYASISKGNSTNLYATGATNFTFEAWVKFPTLPGSGTQVNLYTQSWKTGGNLSFALQLDNTGGTYGIRVRIGGSGGQDDNRVVGNLGLSTNTWYHIAVVYTAASHKIEVFKNGISNASDTGFGTTSIFNGTDPVVFAAEGDFSNKANVRFVLARFWRTTRTASDLSNNWCTELGSTTNLGAEWTFDNVLTDNSGNANTLTGTGGPTFTTDIPATCSSTAWTKTLTDSVTVTDTLVKSTVRTLTESITASDVLTAFRVFLKTLTESITVTDTLVRSIGKVLSDAVTATDTLVRSIARTLSESTTVTDVFMRSITRVMAEALTLTDTLIKKVNGSDVLWSHIVKPTAAAWSHASKAAAAFWSHINRS